MHTIFALLCFVVVIHWLIFPYPSGLLHWHCGNLTIAPVPAKQPWWIWINTSCEFIMNNCITTTKQSTTKPCAYFLGYTVLDVLWQHPSELVNTFMKERHMPPSHRTVYVCSWQKFLTSIVNIILWLWLVVDICDYCIGNFQSGILPIFYSKGEWIEEFYSCRQPMNHRARFDLS